MVRSCYAILMGMRAPKFAHKLAKMIFPDRHDPPVARNGCEADENCLEAVYKSRIAFLSGLH